MALHVIHPYSLIMCWLDTFVVFRFISSDLFHFSFFVCQCEIMIFLEGVVLLLEGVILGGIVLEGVLLLIPSTESCFQFSAQYLSFYMCMNKNASAGGALSRDDDTWPNHFALYHFFNKILRGKRERVRVNKCVLSHLYFIKGKNTE